MAFVISPAKVAPYIPVQQNLFKNAFLKNYKRVRNLQRDSVYWFTSSRNYRFLSAIAASSFLVLGAAICQLKACDYSQLFVHRTGANFIWSITSLIFSAIEFARIFRKRDGHWTWEVGTALWLVITILVSGLTIANNVAATMDLAPSIYRTEQTTPFPYYYGMTTARWPPSTTFNPNRVGIVMNEWDTWQWSTWRKAVFVLYVFCTVAVGLVTLCCYLPYIFFKINEYQLGYGRRLLSNGQIYDVTKNAFRAYKAAVYNRERLQRVIDEQQKPPVEELPLAYPVETGIAYPGAGPMEFSQPELTSTYPYPPAPSSSVSSGRFKRAFQPVKPRKTAWLPMFTAATTDYTSRPSYYNYDDDYYYSYGTSPSFTSSSYYTGSSSGRYYGDTYYTETYGGSSTGTYTTSTTSTETSSGTSSGSAEEASETTSRTRSTSRSSQGDQSKSRSYTYGTRTYYEGEETVPEEEEEEEDGEEEEGSFTEYIHIGDGTDYTGYEPNVPPANRARQVRVQRRPRRSEYRYSSTGTSRSQGQSQSSSYTSSSRSSRTSSSGTRSGSTATSSSGETKSDSSASSQTRTSSSSRTTSSSASSASNDRRQQRNANRR